MYGTVMVGRLREPADEKTRERLRGLIAEWDTQRRVPGFARSDLLFGDDGRTVVNAVQFASRDEYLELAKDPDQDEWWRQRIAPLLDGEPRWVDGDWLSYAR